MSKADDMFEELGYEIYDITNELIVYKRAHLYFDEDIEFYIETKEVLVSWSDGQGASINVELLKAINEKCKELGWLDDVINRNG